MALALAVLLAAPAPGQARAHHSSPVPQGFVGMNADAPVFPAANGVNLAHQLDVMVASGVDSLRVVFDWASAQPYQSWSDVPAGQAGQFVDVGGIPTTFTAFDQIVGLAAQRHLTVLPTVLDAPPWDADPHPNSAVAMPNSDYWYGVFFKALVKRYGPGGSFWADHSPSIPIRRWQVWNEPSLTAFWQTQPFQYSYVLLLRVAHDAIKSVDPGAQVVLAGLPNYSWIDLGKIYNAGGRGLFDVVAIHPYTRHPRGVITILRYVRGVMNGHGDTHMPMFADEVAWPSSLGKTFHTEGFDFATTEAGQARNISTVLPMLARARKRLRLLAFYWYDWAGLERHNAQAFDFAGLFRFSGGHFVAKPAFPAFRRGALSLEHCRRKGKVATRCVH